MVGINEESDGLAREKPCDVYGTPRREEACLRALEILVSFTSRSRLSRHGRTSHRHEAPGQDQFSGAAEISCQYHDQELKNRLSFLA